MDSPLYLFPFFFQLHRERWWWWEMLHLGLEDHKNGGQMEGTWENLCCSNLASSWNFKGGHCRLGWTGKALGLKRKEKTIRQKIPLFYKFVYIQECIFNKKNILPVNFKDYIIYFKVWVRVIPMKLQRWPLQVGMD